MARGQHGARWLVWVPPILRPQDGGSWGRGDVQPWGAFPPLRHGSTFLLQALPQHSRECSRVATLLGAAVRACLREPCERQLRCASWGWACAGMRVLGGLALTPCHE